MAFDKIPDGATLQPTSYTLRVPQDEIDRFHQSLKLSRLAPKTWENLQEETTFGVTFEWMGQAVRHWTESYDWRAREKRINSFPNFMIQITNGDDGDDNGYVHDVHFAALFSNRTDAVPIVLLHGWPGSFLEFFGMMDILRDRYTPDTLPYHIIVPSLPGYCLSSGPPLDRDFTISDVAQVIDKLMVGLGFGSGYVAQGGDIGSFVCRSLAKYPSCKAIHLNFCTAQPPAEDPFSNLNEGEQAALAFSGEFAKTGFAYGIAQGTRPATIGFVLSSSPVALLAWIGEKFITWTDETPPLDDILDSITLYWFTESLPRCIYPYRETYSLLSGGYNQHSDPEFYISKPLGYSFFPHEMTVPSAWVAKTGNLVWSRQHDKGGHFAAMERPRAMLEDVEDFVQQVWKAQE